MTTPTYIPLANVTLGSSASSVTFSSIPATFRDLVFIFNGGAATGTTNLGVKINADAGANYTIATMNGSTAQGVTSFSGDGGILNFFGFPSADLNTTIVAQFLDASATDKHKAVLSRANNVGNGVAAVALRYASTSAITSLEFVGTQQNLRAGSTFALYGIKA